MLKMIFRNKYLNYFVKYFILLVYYDGKNIYSNAFI
jgi:hypothetical protein